MFIVLFGVAFISFTLLNPSEDYLWDGVMIILISLIVITSVFW